ncbi:SUKH-4 family immunity protein [Kitasatospora sp. NPDC057198]|uniref:SUKH-4 family immunity protein n=1 Tax=Kitasatospora sp. NPDC057198 TaxID=3346046 RepID=UPI0036454AA7
MNFLVGREEMEAVFGAEELVTLDDRALAGIAHEPTRAFLREVGLPDRIGWFEADQSLCDGALRVGGESWARFAADYPDCPFDMSSWTNLGGIGFDSLVIDTSTGQVYCVPDGQNPHRLNSSIDSLAFFLHALEAERPHYDPDASEEGATESEESAERLLALMKRTDPAAVEDPESYWHSVLEQVADALDC